MQKKCFPFDIKKSSHQLSKHQPGRRAGMLLQSSGEHKAGAFLQNCVKRNLRLWPQLRGRGGNTARVPDRQLLRPRGPRRVEGLLNGGVFSTDSRGVAPPHRRQDAGSGRGPSPGRFYSATWGRFPSDAVSGTPSQPRALEPAKPRAEGTVPRGPAKRTAPTPGSLQ